MWRGCDYIYGCFIDIFIISFSLMNNRHAIFFIFFYFNKIIYFCNNSLLCELSYYELGVTEGEYIPHWPRTP